ncbi:MAG: hypothetical protein R3208_01365 [Ketobacteraceae bacterium]|nr:hypothetical protein [Ketobacteraceae bacterium]
MRPLPELPGLLRLLSLSACMLLTGNIAVANYQGIARAPDSGKILYREVHCTETPPHTAENLPAETVFYLDENNNRIATKRINGDFRFVPGRPVKPDTNSLPEGISPGWVPQYEFIHHTLGLAEGIAYQGDRILLKRREGKQVEPEVKQLSFASGDSPLIADAGFDVFIRDNMSRLIGGESLKVTYLSAPRLSTLDFTLEPEKTGDDTLRILMYPRNFVIRLLVDPITVVYDIPSGRLQSFQGLTNVPRNQDDNFVAFIQYQYGEDLDAFCH